METFSALLAICARNSPVTGEFPTQRPVTQSLDVFFDLHPNKPLSKQWWGWWFETLSRPSWRHCNDSLIYQTFWHHNQPHPTLMICNLRCVHQYDVADLLKHKVVIYNLYIGRSSLHDTGEAIRSVPRHGSQWRSDIHHTLAGKCRDYTYSGK